MATYNEKGTLPSEGDANVGLDPTSTGKNRQFFWNDRFVEPKRCTINFSKIRGL